MVRKKSFASGYILDGHGGAEPLDIKKIEVLSDLKRPVWVHLNLSDPQALRWLEKRDDLSLWVRENLTNPNISEPHIRIRQDSLLLVLRTVNIMPGAEPDDLVFLRLYATDKILISTRLHPAINFEEMDELFADKDGPKDMNGLILSILENTLDGVSDSIVGIENQVDELEEKIIVNNIPQNTYQQLSELLRQVIVIRRFMAPEREAIGNLIRHGSVWFTADMDRGLRDNFDWIQRIIEDIDLLEKRIRVNQDALKNMDDKKVQRNMYMLSVIAGIFLPLSFLASVFGMNLEGIPLGGHRYGFLMISLLMVFIGCIVLFVFKKLKWI